MFSLVSQPALRRRLTLFAWLLVTAVPVAYIVGKIVVASRNIVFWDEFDTALDLILRINAGADWHELLQRFFAVNNEHRTVTSRLLFAASYWLTGTINFHVIGAIGNLFLVGACATLLAAVQGWERRVRLGVVLAFLLFQLENFENFIWSGSSIDHFQVVMLGVLALAALARGSIPAAIAAGIFGVLATFTLAQGSMVWPVGALLLWHQRRWRQLAGWCVVAVAVVAMFLYGFEFNPGHHITELTTRSFTHVARYWLALLGSPLTLGDAGFAPIPGVVLLAGLAIAAWRGAAQRQTLAWFVSLFCIGSLALVAFGRSELAGAEISSRYMVLAALAWALLLFILIEAATEPARPFRWLAYAAPALVGFAVSADLRYAPQVDSFIEVRDRAATQFKQYGEDGRGITRLHPRQGHADTLLKMAADRGVYSLPRMSFETGFQDPRSSSRMITYVDEVLVNDRAVTIGGWAMLPGQESKRGKVYVVLRSAQGTRYYSTVTLQRSDVAQAYHEPRWKLSGFRAVIGRDLLPAEDFEIGVLIADLGNPEFLMTANRLDLAAADARAPRVSGSQ